VGEEVAAVGLEAEAARAAARVTAVEVVAVWATEGEEAREEARPTVGREEARPTVGREKARAGPAESVPAIPFVTG